MRLAQDKLNELKANVASQIESVFTFAMKSDHIPPGGGKADADAIQGRLWMLGFQSHGRGLKKLSVPTPPLRAAQLAWLQRELGDGILVQWSIFSIRFDFCTPLLLGKMRKTSNILSYPKIRLDEIKEQHPT